MSHTPGPWKFSLVVNEPAGFPLAAMLLETTSPKQPMNDPCVLAVREDWFGYLTRTDRGKANVRLIEAAPDLLAACEAAFTYNLTAAYGQKMTVGEVNKILEAAIAKAKGKA